MKCWSVLFVMFIASGAGAQPAPAFGDPSPQRYVLQARGSRLDTRAQPHPEINFVFEKECKVREGLE